uniref:Zinc finger translocation associated n=1 Tax=Gasterosteus aculeatus aculeatus TaxID=481459 RepID=A0AAQ4S4Z6_GASAC
MKVNLAPVRGGAGGAVGGHRGTRAPRCVSSGGPDQPFLLSPAPGPSGRKPRVQRASRPGLSRIPGRDHRRYYHEYWRCEYLMDFDPQRHGMICMVCGSSLATLKLSTIKRHIRQKHPDSLLWSTADKEVIRSGWESHLSLGGVQRSYGSVAEQPQQPPSLPPCSEEGEAAHVQAEEQDLAGPSAQTLERYLNDSLHAWFRQEFLMEYEAEAGRLLCMVCGGEVPSLHLDHIKSHVLDTHPNSLVYSSVEKHCILQAWFSPTFETHCLSELPLSRRRGNPDPDTKEGGLDLFAQAMQTNTDVYPEGDGTLTQDAYFIAENGGVRAPRSPRQPRKKRLNEGDSWRLRLDYLVAHGPQGRGTFCMVCSQVLHEIKVSSFRRHIQECHPETTTLSRQEREAMAAETSQDASPDVRGHSKAVKKEEGVSGGKGRVREDGAAAASFRHGHYPGKDQRRNYQVRWRMEYLMDYDCRRHGLICMVCGATLATLKVSTIKRHVQQVHPHSLDYSPEEKQQAMLSYNQAALHFIHSDDSGCQLEPGDSCMLTQGNIR